MKQKFEGVIFDMDGLMFDSERLIGRAWEEVGKELGYEGCGALLNDALGKTKEMIRSQFAERFGEFPYDEFYAQTDSYTLDYVEKYGIPVKDGLYELIEYLDNHGVKKAVASSSPAHRVNAYLSSAGLEKSFDAIINGSMIENSKPNPEIYLKACAAIGVSPIRCAALEDSYSGIRSAYAAGLKAYMIPDLMLPDREILELCEAVLPSLTKFTKLLKCEI